MNKLQWISSSMKEKSPTIRKCEFYELYCAETMLWRYVEEEDQ